MTATGLAFLAAYLFGLLRAFISHPRWGLYTYIGTFYLHPPMRWWGATLPDLRWSLTAAIVTLLALPGAKIERSASPWTSHTFTKVMLAYVAWMWIQVGWGNPEHFEGLILMTKFVILHYLIYHLVRNQEDLIGFGFAHVIGCFYFGLLALAEASGGRLENVGGPGVSDSNTLGMHLSTGLLFAGALILTQRGWKRWAVIGTVPFIANAIVQTQSRGAFVGAVAGGLVYYYFAPRVHRKVMIPLGALCFCILLAYTPLDYWTRMNTLNAVAEQNEQMDSSAKSRLYIAQAQWRMFLDHPLGLGTSTTTYLSRDYLDHVWLSSRGARASHNTLLSIMTDQGVPGVILGSIGLLSMIGVMLRLKRMVPQDTEPLLASMLAAVCGSLTVAFLAGMTADYLRAEVQLWCLALLLACLQMSQRRLLTLYAEPPTVPVASY